MGSITGEAKCKNTKCECFYKIPGRSYSDLFDSQSFDSFDECKSSCEYTCSSSASFKIDDVKKNIQKNTNSITKFKQLCTSNGGTIEKIVDTKKIWCDVRGDCNTANYFLKQKAKDAGLSVSFWYRCKDATQGHCVKGHTCEMILNQ